MIKIPNLQLEDVDYKIVQDEFMDYYTSSITHRHQMDEDEQFYLGNQYSTAQKNYLIGLGQSDQPNNKIKPAVEQVLANVASTEPDWSVRPFGQTDNDVAFVVNKLFTNIWDKSEGNRQFRHNTKDHIVKGKTHLYIYPDWNAEDGQGGLRIMELDGRCVFVSANTSLEDFSNTKSMYYSDIHTKTDLKAQFPQYADKIKKAKDIQDIKFITNSLSSRDSITVRGDVRDDKEEKIRRYNRFAKVAVPYVKITNSETGYWMLLDDEEYKETLTNPEFVQYIADGVIQEEIIYKTHIRESFFIGDQEIYDEVLPISEYPIKTSCNEWTRDPYPSGDVRQAKGPQRKLNRTEALIIAHTTATAGINVGYEEGAIDISEIMKMNLPGRVPIKFNPGGLSNKKYHEFGISQVNTELYHEKARYVSDIEAVFGAYGWQQGDAGGSPGTVGEAQILEEASARKQNWKMIPLYDMLNGIARVALEWIPYVYDQQRVMRIVNPDGSEKDIILNQLVRNKDGAIEKLYDMTSLQVDVRAIVGSARAQSPMAKLNKNLGLQQAGIYDKVEVILGLEENIDKQALLQRMDENAQLRQAVEQLTKKVEEQEGDLQTREREIYHTLLRLKVSEGTKELDSAITKVKSNVISHGEVVEAKITAKSTPQNGASN